MNSNLDDDDWNYVPKGMTDEEVEENIKYFKNHPLFMREQPEDINNNPEFQALQNLAFDDTPENVARSCNERGNALYKKGPDILYYIKEALKSYEEGLDLNCKDSETNTKLLSNKTLINLKLKNYGKVIADCKKIIEINEKFIKAYFRYGSALFFLNKLDDAMKIIEQGLKIEKDHKDLKELREEVGKKRKLQEEKEKGKLSKKEKEVKIILKQHDFRNKKFQALIEKLKENQIMLGQQTMEMPEAYEKTLYFDEAGQIHIPLLIYYPEFQQTDFIQDTRGKDLLIEHLNEVFQGGLPWDSKGDYKSLDRIKCFIQLNSSPAFYKLKGFDPKNFDSNIATFKAINLKTPILDILRVEGHVVPMILEVYLLSEHSKFLDIFASMNKILS